MDAAIGLDYLDEEGVNWVIGIVTAQWVGAGYELEFEFRFDAGYTFNVLEKGHFSTCSTTRAHRSKLINI